MSVYMICHIILTIIWVVVVSIEMIEISALVAKNAKNIRDCKLYIRLLLLLGTGLILCLLKGKSTVFGLAFGYLALVLFYAF